MAFLYCVVFHGSFLSSVYSCLFWIRLALLGGVLSKFVRLRADRSQAFWSCLKGRVFQGSKGVRVLGLEAVLSEGLVLFLDGKDEDKIEIVTDWKRRYFSKRVGDVALCRIRLYFALKESLKYVV